MVATKMVQYFITPYDGGYCFVHEAGHPSKYIFSTEKATHIHTKSAKLFRIDASYFELVYKDGKVERFPYMYIESNAIVGTKYRSMGKVSEDDVHIPSH
jgi:hypothetical protein